mgnify:CR=1 FL=1
MIFENLTEQNFILYAMKIYENPQCLSEKDFEDDLKILKYLKRLFNRYQLTKELKHRLILNHLIMFTNVFPIPESIRILFLKIEDVHWPLLKSFLLHLNFMPDFIEKVNGKTIYSSNINENKEVYKFLAGL